MRLRFPYLPVASGLALAPILPIQLSRGGTSVNANAIIDSGAAVNVLPYPIGLALGADWNVQNINIPLTGNLATAPAKALLLKCHIASFPIVSLMFAWSRLEKIPLLLGQVNFFDEFDVCFHRSSRYFELEPSTV